MLIVLLDEYGGGLQLLQPIWISENSAAKWDTFVYNHPYGSIGNLFSWKRIIEESFNHIKGSILALVDDEYQIIAGISVYTVKSWLTGKRVVCAPFSTIFDPLVSNDEQFQELLFNLVKFYKKENFSSLEIRTLKSTSLIEANDFTTLSYYKHQYLNLQGDLESLKRSFHNTGIRQPLSRAIKSNLKCRRTYSIDDLKTFYHLYFLTRKRLGLPAIPFLFYESIWKHLSKSEEVVIFVAELGSKPVGAMLLLQFQDRLLADALGWDREFKTISPSVSLYWEAIQYAHKQGLKIFDFGRTFALNENLLSFKSRWNTEIEDFVEIFYPVPKYINYLPKEFSKKYALFVKTAKIVPSPIFRILSSFLYRHLG